MQKKKKTEPDTEIVETRDDITVITSVEDLDINRLPRIVLPKGAPAHFSASERASARRLREHFKRLPLGTRIDIVSDGLSAEYIRELVILAHKSQKVSRIRILPKKISEADIVISFVAVL